MLQDAISLVNGNAVAQPGSSSSFWPSAIASFFKVTLMLTTAGMTFWTIGDRLGNPGATCSACFVRFAADASSANAAGAKAGTIGLSATRARQVVAKGSGKADKKGAATIRLRFTKKARRSLRHAKTITLKVSGAGATTTIRLKRR